MLLRRSPLMFPQSEPSHVFRLWLTDAGLKEASAIVQAIRNSAEQALKRPIGFSIPDKNEQVAKQ